MTATPRLTVAVLALALALATGCAGSVLRTTRTDPPKVPFTWQTVAVDVTDDQLKDTVRRVVENALAQDGLQVVRCERDAPCAAQIWLRVMLLKSTVGPWLRDIPRNAVELARAPTDVEAKVELKLEGFVNNASAFSRTAWARSTGNLLDQPAEVYTERALTRAVNAFVRDLHPRTLTMELKLETGGALDDGCDKALAGDLEGAEQSLRALVAKEPQNAEAWYDLGVVLEVKGGVEQEALKAYEEAAKLDGSKLHVQARNQLRERLD